MKKEGLIQGLLNAIRKSMMVSLLLTLITVVTLVSIISTISFTKINLKVWNDNLQATVTNSLRFAQLGYAAPLWNIDLGSMSRLDEAILENRILVAVNITSDGMFLCGHVKDETIPGRVRYLPLKSAFTDHGADKHLRQTSGDISYNGVIIGRVELFYTEKYIAEQIRKGAINNLIIFLVIDLLIILIVFSYLNRAAIRPVLNLARVSQQIAAGNDYGVRVERTSRNEIGVLCDGFNNMLQQIQSREQERIQAEKELQHAKNLLNNVVNSMPSLLISTDKNENITHWNNSAVYLSGILAVDAIGKNLWKTAPILYRYQGEYRRVVTMQLPMEFYRVSFKEGDNKFYNVTMFPLIADGAQGVVIRMDDVTELEEKERELRQAQKMETIGMLAGGIAHDFNNVLMGIVGSLSIMQHKILSQEQVDKHEVEKYLNVMQNASLRATDMVRQLLTMSRKQELSFEAVNLKDTIKTVAKICKNTFEKHIELVVELPEENACVLADPSQIEQVLLNLCINGYHAMSIMRPENDNRGGTLTICLQKFMPEKITYNTGAPTGAKPYWKLSVHDTGVGMNSETLGKIFDPFFTTKQKDKGTGLGLTIVYNTIQQHDGFIDVHSEPDKGTFIDLYLPELANGAVRKSSLKEEDIFKGEGLVLVVDDEEIVRQIAKVILEECGYEVMLAEDGEQALEVFRENHQRIKAVLLDMVMPKKVGKEVYQDLKAIDQNVRVLLSSGFKKDERVEAVLQLGINGFIQKPYTLAKLSRAIHSVLN